MLQIKGRVIALVLILEFYGIVSGVMVPLNLSLSKKKKKVLHLHASRVDII